MTKRCGCPAEGDEIVFGPAHECSKNPQPRSVDPVSPVIAALYKARRYRRSDFTLSPPERPYEQVLSDDAEPGDLG